MDKSAGRVGEKVNKEIGGYFGLEQLVDNAYYKNLIGLNSGRNALLYLVRAKGIKKLYIPFYLCDSVSSMLQHHGYDFDYYHIDEDMNPIFRKKLEADSYLYIVNYFGQLDNNMIASLQQKYGRIIVDNTHAFFQEPLSGVDTIYSCRKFFGVPDGAYLSTDSFLAEELETATSKDRMVHVLGRYEGKASDYYAHFKESDASLRHEPLRCMSKLTRNILGAIDYDSVKEARTRNYAYLHRELNRFNKLTLTTPPGPFAYPFYVENGIAVKHRLASKKIYVPTLWPNVLKELPEDSLEYEYSANILPLPCDQRYSIEDMVYLIAQLRKEIIG